MVVETVNQEDLPAILALQKLCFQENAQRVQDWSIAPLVQTQEEILKEFK